MASSVGSSADTAKFGLSSDSDKLPQVPALPASSRTLESDSSDREGIGGKLVVVTTRAPSIRRSSSSRKSTPTRTTSSTPRIRTKHHDDRSEGQRSSSINKRISCETLIPGQTKGTIAEKGEITEVVAPEVSNGNQSGAVQRGSSRKRAAPEDQTARTEVNDKEVRGSTRKWAAPDSSSLTPQGPGGGSGTTGAGSSSRTLVSHVPSPTGGRVNGVDDLRKQEVGAIGSQSGGFTEKGDSSGSRGKDQTQRARLPWGNMNENFGERTLPPGAGNVKLNHELLPPGVGNDLYTDTPGVGSPPGVGNVDMKDGFVKQVKRSASADGETPRVDNLDDLLNNRKRATPNTPRTPATPVEDLRERLSINISVHPTALGAGGGGDEPPGGNGKTHVTDPDPKTPEKKDKGTEKDDIQRRFDELEGSLAWKPKTRRTALHNKCN